MMFQLNLSGKFSCLRLKRKIGMILINFVAGTKYKLTNICHTCDIVVHTHVSMNSTEMKTAFYEKNNFYKGIE